MSFFNQDDKRNKERIKRIENLYPLVELGGFIEEAIVDMKEEIITDILDAETAKMLGELEDSESLGMEQLKTLSQVAPGIDDCFFILDDEDFDAISKYDIDQFPAYDYDKVYGAYKVQTGDFKKWYLSQIVKNNTRDNTLHLLKQFKKHTKNINIRTVLRSLNAVDERIFALKLGIGVEQPMTENEISNLDEFNCNPDYIRMIMVAIYRNFVVREVSMDELYMEIKEFEESEGVDYGK